MSNSLVCYRFLMSTDVGLSHSYLRLIHIRCRFYISKEILCGMCILVNIVGIDHGSFCVNSRNKKNCLHLDIEDTTSK